MKLPTFKKRIEEQPELSPPAEKKYLNAEEVRGKYTPEYLAQKKKEYEEKNAKYIESSIQGQLSCNHKRIETAVERGENFFEIDSRNNCCLNEYGIQRYRELGYAVKEDEYEYVHEGRNKKYKVYTISW